MEKQKKRSEIDNNYKWDLTTIYATEEDWYKEYEQLKKDIEIIPSFKGHIMDSADSLLEFQTVTDALERRLYKLYYYAHLNLDVDTANTHYQELFGKFELLDTKYEELSAYIFPEMMQKDWNYVKGLIDSKTELEVYRHGLENAYRFKEHSLSEEAEELLSTLGNVLGKSSDTFEKLTDSDMKFGTIVDEEGKEIEFTESKWSVLARSKDRRVRKEAFEMLYNVYSSFKNTLASTFAGNAELLIKMAKLKKFNSSLEASQFSDAVTPKMYNQLIDTVHAHLDVLKKYYAVKKELLGLDELHLYDIYVDLVDDYEKTYSFEEAKEMVLTALKPMGEDYLNIIRKAFDEKWIDVYNNEGKRGGAYSSGNFDTNPFILLNYEGKLDDVSTLAHELGHSAHTYLSTHNQEYPNASYKIFVAEVASTVNEMLLRLYLLDHSDDEKEKLYVLNEMLELFKSTIYRQVMFAEFERDMHALRENGEVLTHEVLCKNYLELNKLYFGDDVVVDPLIQYEWSRIPHFYYNFYVYKYAIGLSAASYIATNIYNNVPGALEGYKKFLQSGGSMYPVEELKLAGVDVEDAKTYEAAINMFNDTIDRFVECSKGMKK